MNPSSNPEIESKLEAYTNLVRQYAKTLDLSSPTMLEEFEKAVGRSATYCLSIPIGARVLDIGSGGGLPGIPLAIYRPDLEICLCEIRQRRAAFLERAVSKLNLRNARVHNGDVQKLTELEFDVVTAQAVGSLKHIWMLSKHLLAPSWKIMSIKGENWLVELAELTDILGPRVTIKNDETIQFNEGFNLVCIQGMNAESEGGA